MARNALPGRSSARPALLALAVTASLAPAVLAEPAPPPTPAEGPRGSYFERRAREPVPLPVFEAARALLPRPLFDEQPLWVETYWKAWELAYGAMREPAPGGPLVAPHLAPPGPGDPLALWDMAFAAIPLSTAHPLAPGVAALDNFYARQYESGEIPGELGPDGEEPGEFRNPERRPLFSRRGWHWDRPRETAVEFHGRDAPVPGPWLTLDALDHPIAAWAELESFRYTGDRERLSRVFDPLLRQYRALHHHLRQGNGLFVTDGSSMPGSPRDLHLDRGGCGVDISAEMAMCARRLAAMATLLGRGSEAKRLTRDAEVIATLINRSMWDDGRRFYFDLTLEGVHAPVRTIAGFWPLLAGVASERQAEALVGSLQDPGAFGREVPVPSIAADEPGYRGQGGDWNGGVRASTNLMVVRGLEAYGHDILARELALRYLDAVASIYQGTGTIWESYAADRPQPGRDAAGEPARRDFAVGGGLAPILFLLEYAVGLQPDAPSNTLTWRIASQQRVGCERYRFNGHLVTLVAERVSGGEGGLAVKVTSDGPFTLIAIVDGREHRFDVTRGAQLLFVPV
jgi:hypothetical protein